MRFKLVRDEYRKVYCGWDERAMLMNLYVIISGSDDHYPTDEKKAMLEDKISELSKQKDKYGVTEIELPRPIYTKRSALSKEQNILYYATDAINLSKA